MMEDSIFKRIYLRVTGHKVKDIPNEDWPINWPEPKNYIDYSRMVRDRERSRREMENNMNNNWANPYLRRKKKMSEEITITRERIKKFIEQYPDSKQYWEAFCPELLCNSYVSGDMFFHVDRWTIDNPGLNNIQGVFITKCMNFAHVNFFRDGLPKYIYVLAHLKNAKEYSLFNLHTGYNLHRDEFYLRKQGVGILIPGTSLTGLVKVKNGGGA